MGKAGDSRNLTWAIRICYFLLVVIVAALALRSLKPLHSAPHRAIASLASVSRFLLFTRRYLWPYDRLQYMINNHGKGIPLILSHDLKVKKCSIDFVMEQLLRPFSRTKVQRQNRGVSKWSLHYVKELLLSAPPPPKTIQPC